MHGTYQQNLASYTRYVAKNREKINAIGRKANKKRAVWLKVKKEFLNILLS
jgi:hypothetical protein